MAFLNVVFAVGAVTAALMNGVEVWVASFVIVFAFLSGLFTGFILEEM